MTDSMPQNNGEKPIEKFPKINTIPKGWDLSEVLPSTDGAAPLQEANSDKPKAVKPVEKFPRLNTIPRGWDLSDHIKD